jgi:hypothetical protein
MNVQVISGREEIQKALRTLKAASEPGRSSDGVRLMIHYRAFRAPNAKALQEAAVAREEGLAMDLFTGQLDRVFENKAGELCFSIRCLERQSTDGRHCFRTFNTVKGNVTELVILGNGNGHSRDTKEPEAPEGK